MYLAGPYLWNCEAWKNNIIWSNTQKDREGKRASSVWMELGGFSYPDSHFQSVAPMLGPEANWYHQVFRTLTVGGWVSPCGDGDVQCSKEQEAWQKNFFSWILPAKIPWPTSTGCPFCQHGRVNQSYSGEIVPQIAYSCSLIFSCAVNINISCSWPNISFWFISPSLFLWLLTSVRV